MEVHRVLKKVGNYLIICFSFKNGPAWAHLTEKQLICFFSDYFNIREIRIVFSIEGDGVKRYFYTVWMKKK